MPERILYRDVITYPPLRLDLAFVVDEHVPAGDLLDAAREAVGAELSEARFLSDYRGDQIPAGKKSVAFGFAFQSPERTLSDDDGLRLRDAIVRARRDCVRRRAPGLAATPLELRVQLGPEEDRPRGVVQPEHQDHAGRERAVGLRVAPQRT